MRLRVLSDLHFEFLPDFGQSFVETLAPDPQAVLVLAGDIATLKMRDGVESAFRTLAGKFARVLYVPGNHEFYGISPAEGRAVLDDLGRLSPKITVLRAGELLEHEGVRILGDTLWFPELAEAEPYRRALTDYRAIRNFEPWVYEQNRIATEFLTRNVREGDVVVTHHMPSPRCIDWRFNDSPLNSFFVHDMTGLMQERRPALWIHGHGHEAVDLQEGATRIVANPMGYPHERRRTRFNPGFSVDVQQA